MKKIFFLLVLFLSFSNAIAQDAKENIKSTFWSFTDSAVKSNGEEVVKLFSKSAFDYWSELIESAKNDNKNTIIKLPTYRVFNILLIRQRAKENGEILDMNGQEWLRHSYDMGWNSKKALNTILSNRELFEIVPEVEGTIANLTLKLNGALLPTTFPFIKENGKWKIDGGKQFAQLEKSIEDKKKQAGLTKEEYSEFIYRTLFKTDMPNDLWNPAKVQTELE